MILSSDVSSDVCVCVCVSDVLPSCRNRCYEPFDAAPAACRCDRQCVDTGSCCHDYKDICLLPAQSWDCTTVRCGETRLSDSRCHCSEDCTSAGDCCSNYNTVCKGESLGSVCFKRQPLLLVSLDGLRAEYLQMWGSLVPVLDKIRQCGTSSPFMQAVFPSKTFPNHYSIATGLYAESHGLVDNNMYDPVFDASFSLSNSEKNNPRWYQGQPLIMALQVVDRAIGQLMNGLKQLNLHQCVNIIIVADHVDAAALVANMSQIKPYLKHHLPKRFHYTNNRRIEDVSVLVNPRWLFERYPGSLTFCSGGNHGYDNDIYSMQAAFLSFGPKFLFQTEVEPFSNIELYNLMCDVLEITPFLNNGTHGSLNHLLRTPVHNPSHPTEQSGPRQCPITGLEPTDTLGCSCTALSGSDINSRLNLTDAEVADSERRHMLFGRPRVLQSDAEYCVLNQHGFITAYSTHTHTPVWSSFTVDRTAGSSPVVSDCLRADIRIPANQSATCNQYNITDITYGFLYPPKLWQYFQEVLLLKYASQYNGINVVTGPAYDYNYDGRFDSPDQILEFVAGSSVPLPTHYFAVLTSCRNETQAVGECSRELQSVSFLLPHRDENTESCADDQLESQWVEPLLWMHQSRVRDVEWITGLDFFQDSERPIAELLRLKTRPTAAIHPKA
ncbi:Ectonucleotide pyrophosphatase/phosphodiesterase family member 3 [Anabarilius grahami]|uniref:Ectonucleotide pyrophosphatase/phosphodiesterase family member 3 n=1 Tax=Anabarilius grahami TaxID=495550 RepID=A0A3N0Y0U2_ANAGA|nr:Ectonucleotide pyrophosphatase/phosphodiesterase family member 3 [Anabarilius grahami]